ncbi:hypothetical protein Tco_0890981 [Tanacetum coccineum]|uniref:Reverse transcriptase domain-containing protein n=1 Tax=Tanacetum coccineum TaxID=301880 RepID=A0ABQ5C745_9ASTR
MRWILLLQEFDVVIRDKKGAENLAADHLSRLENPHQDKLENKEITETFPLETLGSVALRVDSTPGFCRFVKQPDAGNFIVKGISNDPAVCARKGSSLRSRSLPHDPPGCPGFLKPLVLAVFVLRSQELHNPQLHLGIPIS